MKSPSATSSSLLSANGPIILTSTTKDSSPVFECYTNRIALSLASFVQHYVCEVHPQFHMQQQFAHFILLIFILKYLIKYFIYTSQFIVYSTEDRYLLCFQLETIINNVFLFLHAMVHLSMHCESTYSQKQIFQIQHYVEAQLVYNLLFPII